MGSAPTVCMGSIGTHVGTFEEDIRRWNLVLNRRARVKLPNIYKANEKPITIYGSECWTNTIKNRGNDSSGRNGFFHASLHRVCCLEHITSEEIQERTNSKETVIHGIEMKHLV